MQYSYIANKKKERKMITVKNKQAMGAYIHIPFCNYKCHFCDFVTAVGKDDLQESYSQVVCQEIEQRIKALSEKPVVQTVFYGGGTPGALESNFFSKIHNTLLDNVKLAADAEINLETTPETINLEKASLWHGLGINRLSIGIQSFDDQQLAGLGRKHTVAQAVTAVDVTAQAGFGNINCDLMYGLPTQNLASWKRSLDSFVKLSQQFPQIKHLSAYALELAPQTPLAKMFPEAGDSKAAENEYLAQHNYLLQTLAKSGFEQYEISNFSKAGFQSRHNLNYWQQGNYLAFGVSAHRHLSPYRSANWRSLPQYMHDWLGDESLEFIDEHVRFKEAIMLGLRMTTGINLQEFKQIFGVDLLQTHSHSIKPFLDANYLAYTEGRLKLTATGQPVANSIIAAFF